MRRSELGFQDGGIDRYDDLILIPSYAGWKVRKARLSLVAPPRSSHLPMGNLTKADRSAMGRHRLVL
jgi:hypothetical protein